MEVIVAFRAPDGRTRMAISADQVVRGERRRDGGFLLELRYPLALGGMAEIRRPKDPALRLRD